MHVWEGTMQPKDGNIERICEWWKSLLSLSGCEGFENGVALNRMDGENSVLIIRHTFDDLAHEQRAWDIWNDSEVHKKIQAEWDEYCNGPVTVHRYYVQYSY